MQKKTKRSQLIGKIKIQLHHSPNSLPKLLSNQNTLLNASQPKGISNIQLAIKRRKIQQKREMILNRDYKLMEKKQKEKRKEIIKKKIKLHLIQLTSKEYHRKEIKRYQSNKHKSLDQNSLIDQFNLQPISKNQFIKKDLRQNFYSPDQLPQKNNIFQNFKLKSRKRFKLQNTSFKRIKTSQVSLQEIVEEIHPIKKLQRQINQSLHFIKKHLPKKQTLHQPLFGSCQKVKIAKRISALSELQQIKPWKVSFPENYSENESNLN